jgi:hypothetical protein
MLTVIDRGIEIMLGPNGISVEIAEALRLEARSRVQTGSFFGHIAYGSLVARKP